MPNPDPLTEIPVTSCSWQQVLQDAVRTIDELAELLDLTPADLQPGHAAADDFPLLVPRGFVDRMQRGDPNDPLLRQVLPTPLETVVVEGYTNDPLNEIGVAAGGVLQKYAARTLLVTTGACPVHCRYCFRRAFPYSAQHAGRDDWDPALDRLAANGESTEVILSGGDPLTLPDARLERLLRRIVALPNVTALRLHTRFPIVIPERVSARLTTMLAAQPKPVVVVVHCNHPNELDDSATAALSALKPAVTALLNQSVLLRGVNDEPATLIALSRRLFAAGVLPYYLHMLDRVAGAAHFAVPDAAARTLIRDVRHALPGYLVPRLVREQSGRLSKTPVR